MNKIEKAVAMFLSAAVIITGSAGIAGKGGEAAVSDEPKASLRPAFGYLLSTEKDGGETNRKELFNEIPKLSEQQSEPISRQEFVFLLTGIRPTDEGGTELLSREAAAGIVFMYLMNDGYEQSDAAGSLSVFPDGIQVSPQYAQAVYELYQLAIYEPIGNMLKPLEWICRRDAEEMIGRALSAEFQQDSFSKRLRMLLGCGSEEIKLLESMLACVIGAMLAQDIYCFSSPPELTLSSPALYNAVSWGIVPEDICTCKTELITILSQAGMQKLYKGIFSEGEFTVIDPASAGGNLNVLGDLIAFLPNKKQDISVSAGTAIPEPNGSVTVCCTVYVLQKYCCTAQVNLKKTDGWAAGYSVRSVLLSVG